MSLKKNFLFNSLLSLSQIIFPIITFPYVTRVLLPEGLGSVNFVDSFVQYIIIAAALGIPVYGVREIARVKNNRACLSRTFSELMIIHSVLSVVFSLLFLVITYLVPELSTEYQLCMVGTGIILSNVFLINWFYAGLEKFSFISLVSIIVRIITILLIFIFVKTKEDKILYYCFSLLGNVIAGIFNICFALRYVRFTTRKLHFFRHLRPLFLLFSLTVITSIYVLLDSVILGFIRNNTEVGYYTTALKISKIPITLLTALTSVLIPRLSSIDGRNQLERLIEKSLKINFILSIPIAVGIFCLSKDIIMVFAGELYLPALLSFEILSFIIIPIGFALVSYQILLPNNKEKYMMYCSLVGVAVSLILNFVLVPEIGNVGSAVSNITTEVSVAILLYMFSRRVYKIVIPVKLISQSCLACLSFFVLHYFFRQISDNSLVIVFLTAGSGMVIYFFLMNFVFRVQLIRDIYSNLLHRFLLNR